MVCSILHVLGFVGGEPEDGLRGGCGTEVAEPETDTVCLGLLVLSWELNWDDIRGIVLCDTGVDNLSALAALTGCGGTGELHVHDTLEAALIHERALLQ